MRQTVERLEWCCGKKQQGHPPGLTKVVIPKGAGLSEDRVNLRLLPALCKTENVNSLVHDVVIYESSFVCQ